jgi:hypothetical protein
MTEFISITATTTSSGKTHLYALDRNGGLWILALCGESEREINPCLPGEALYEWRQVSMKSIS